jgi:hypothetical protein
VGRFWLFDTNLNSQKPTLTLALALSQRERELTRGVWENYADVKYRVELRL